MLEYDKIDILEEIDSNQIIASKKCDVCHCWYFLDKNFKDEPCLGCNGCHDLMQKAMNFNGAVIVSVKESDFIFGIWAEMMQ